MEPRSYPPDPHLAPRPSRDWTFWLSMLIALLMLLNVLMCGGLFLYSLAHRPL